MVVLNLEELKEVWRKPHKAIQYIQQTSGNIDKLVEEYFHTYISETGINRDRTVSNVARCVPWWQGEMPCVLHDKGFYYDDNHFMTRWKGRYGLLKQKIRPALQNYFKKIAIKTFYSQCARLLSMSAICNNYSGLQRLVKQCKVYTGTFKTFDVHKLYLNVIICSGIHYEDVNTIVSRMESWMRKYLEMYITLKLPQEIILLCAEYLDINGWQRVKRKRFRHTDAPGTGGIRLP